jgi:thimet oligopeptidase
VVISTDQPEYYEFVTYALDRSAARDLYVKFVNRGGDLNVARLDKILALRREKARLLGYDNWASYVIDARMAKRPSEVSAFLGRIRQAIAKSAARELQEFRAELDRVPNVSPTRAMIEPDRYFIADRIKSKRLKLDTQALAEYFEVEAVTKGLLDLTAQMYELEYREVPARAWHPSVKTFEAWAGGKSIATIHLDLFPRPHKYRHAAMFSIRTGKTLADGTRQTPMAALICNFPGPGEPMPHDQVATYFHELGHVLQHVLTETELSAFAGTGSNTPRDFVEAPSQLFEEWAWSREVLDRFARHRKTGEKIPPAMMDALSQSRRVGLALSTERQLFLAALDLAFHTAEPPFDTTALLAQVQDANFSFKYVKGTHFQSSFSHLIGYDAGYYSYQWGMALAIDAFARFQKEGLLTGDVAKDWRRKVLAKGSSRDERAMLRDFLGREPSEDAYVQFLTRE